MLSGIVLAISILMVYFKFSNFYGRRMAANDISKIFLKLLLVVAFINACSTTSDLPQAEKPVYPPAPNEARFYFQQSLMSSADVEREDGSAFFKRIITGQTRTGIGMGKPFGVSVHQGRVFVSDTVRRMVMVFDKPAAKYFEIGTAPPGELFKPMGLDVDQKGDLYVCDATMKHVVVYDRDGKYLRTIGDRDKFSRPAGLTVDPEGIKVFVVDTGGVKSDKHRVVVFNAQTGEFLYNISKRGSGEGELNLPREATIAADGNLYVVDGGNFRIQVFSQYGQYLRSFGDIGRRSGQFSRPKGVGTDQAGNIYVADTAFGNFQIFNSEGRLLLAVGSRNSQPGPGHFMLPAGLALDEDGRVYMVDQYFKKVDVFRPASLPEDQGYFSLPK